MPVISDSMYKSPRLLVNAHLQTIVPAALRKVRLTTPLLRVRITTPDDDFLDIDWSGKQHDRLAIISHGLEGNSTRPYMKGMINALWLERWDVMAWNYRGCSGEINKNLRLYHSGATDDLETVATYAASLGYKQIALLGFSLGGNLTLKYLGESTTTKPPQICAAVVLSVPLDLHACSIQINKRENIIYSLRFIRSLKTKIRMKSDQHKGAIDLQRLASARSVFDIDEYFTAPLHGFDDAIDYYTKCSSIHFVETIAVPTLVINAKNDPFLAAKCFSEQPFDRLAHVYLELPKHGGHCGFATYGQSGKFWSENRAVSFLREVTRP